jgi:hypothetical protein
MKYPSQETMRVLAISPTNSGFGFVVFEGAERVIDWGLKTTRIRTAVRCTELAAELLERYTPDAVVVEDLTGKSSRRGPRARELLAGVVRLSSQSGIDTVRISRSAVKEAFVELSSTTKYEIASTIATQLPELAPWLPKPRKPWMSEDCRMGIFDAAALALTFFAANSD